jgi:hypothetical protein
MMEKGNMHVIPCFQYYYNETAASTYWLCLALELAFSGQSRGNTILDVRFLMCLSPGCDDGDAWRMLARDACVVSSASCVAVAGEE